MNRITMQKAVLFSIALSTSLCADIHDRIEYKLNRVLRDVEIINNGNAGNCTPITQVAIDKDGGVFTITESGEYCVTNNLVGRIVVNADCVCINLNCQTVDAGGDAYAFEATGHEGLKIFNGCITNASDAAILVSNCTAVELFNLHIHDNANDSVRAENSTVVAVHDVDFIGGAGSRAVGLDTCSNVNIARCEMTGFESTGSAILAFDNCSCAAVQDVNVCGNAFSSQSDAAGIVVANSNDVVIEHSHVYDTTTSVDGAHGILIDTCLDTKVIRSQVHRNQGAGVELIGDNTTISILKCIAKDNDKGFEFVESSTATCCLVRDCLALNNNSFGFVHATSPLQTTFIGNEAQCNGQSAADGYVINGGVISLYELAWDTGFMKNVSGEETISRWTNVNGVPTSSNCPLINCCG